MWKFGNLMFKHLFYGSLVFISVSYITYSGSIFHLENNNTSQLGMRKLLLLHKAIQELLNMKDMLAENDQQYEIKYNSSG